MRRIAKLRKGEPWNLARLPMVAAAGGLIMVSCLFSVSFGYRLGLPSGTQWAFVAVSLAIEFYAAFALPALWPGLKFIARIVLVGFLGVCLAYKVTAAHRFAAENLGQREAARERQVDDYQYAENRVKTLRGKLPLYADARVASIIQSEIDALLLDPQTDGCVGAPNGPVMRRVCPQVAKLRIELQRAKESARIERDLAAAIGKLDGKAPVAAVSSDATGPVPWLLALFGLSAGSFQSFAATMIMLIVEPGSIILPMLIGFASQSGRKPEARQVERSPDETASPSANGSPRSPAPAVMTEKGKRDVAELTRFLGDATDRAPGARIQSATLYLIYSNWAQSARREPMTLAQFGNVLTRHLGLSKVKADGKIHYLNLRLKPAAASGKASRRLQPVGDERMEVGRSQPCR